MATYPTVTTPYLPTVTSKVITSVDKNGLNPIANMVIKMFEVMKENFEASLTSTTSDGYKEAIIPYNFLSSEYDNKLYLGYYRNGNTPAFAANVNIGAYVTPATEIRYGNYDDSTILYNPFVEQDTTYINGYATAKFESTLLYYRNYNYETKDVSEFLTDSYTSSQLSIKAYKGIAGSRTESNYNKMFMILKFAGFWTCKIDESGNYINTPHYIDNEIYVFVMISEMFTRLDNYVFNYIGIPEINTKIFDDGIKTVLTTPPNVTSAQFSRQWQLNKSDITKLFNVIGIPFTHDTDQIQNETFTDGYNPDYKYVEKGNGQPDNEAGGGDGTGDNTEDNFELPTPSINPASAAVNQYVLNHNQVYSFLEELFNGTFWTNSDLLNKNPKESVVSLTAWPINLLNWDLNHVGVSELIQCGNVKMEYASGQPIQNGYNKIIDVGEYEIKKYFGSFMDYLTKIEIFLPFAGWRTLSTQNVMGRTIKVRYVLNFEDGGIVVYVTSSDGTIERLEQVEQAKLAFDIPIFTSNINEKEKEKLQLLITAAISTASAGMGAMGSGAAGVVTAAGKEAVSGANKIFALQEHINGGNVVASNATWYLPNKCILKFTRPRKSVPSGYARVNGYPANYTAKLGDVTGYTEVEDPVINGIECTENERAQIKALLQGGIYL